MRKILVRGSLLVIFMFLVSCTPQITDEELEAELAKLTPEEREQLLEDLENEGGALAGQAIAKKYSSSKLAYVNKGQMQDVLLSKLTCTDSDDGLYIFSKGVVKGYYLTFEGGTLVNQADKCDGDEVIEGFCSFWKSGHPSANITRITCSYGCSNGACCPESGCLTVQQSKGTPQIIQN